MANQYKNLAEFNAYKDRISEYIAQELAKFPNYLNFIQKSVSGLSWRPPTTEQINSEWYPEWFEDYDINQDGLLDLLDAQEWGNVYNRPDIGAELTLIITGDAEMPPRHPSYALRYMQKDGGWFQKTLKEGKIYKGRNTDEIMVVFDDEFSSQPDDVFIIDYIAYKLAGNEPEQTINVKLLNTDDVEFSWLPFPMPYIEINNLDKVILAPDAFKRIFEGTEWQQYYGSDLGVDADQALQNVENLLTERGFKTFRQDEYKLWDNTSQFLPVGVRKRKIARPILEDLEDIDITELLPGDLQERIDNFFDNWNNLKESIPVGYNSAVGYNIIANGDFGGGIGPGTFIGSIDNENVTQDIVVKENPGFSPYVLRTSSNSNHYYNIELINPVFAPNQTITFSCWACKGEGFNGNLNKLFARAFEFEYASGTSATIVVQANNFIDPTQNLETWSENADELTWRRYQNTFTIPENPNPDEQVTRVIVTWRLNSLQSVPDNQNNDNISFKFITGLRAEPGPDVNSGNFINLTANNPKTHYQILKDIQALTLNGQSPIFSVSTLRNFLDAQKISGILEELYNELLEFLQNTFKNLVESTNSSTTEIMTNFQNALELSAAANNQTIETSDISSEIGNFSETISEEFIPEINALIEEIKKIKLWITGLDLSDNAIFKIDENPVDGFDDASYNAGLAAGRAERDAILGRIPVDNSPEGGDTFDDPSYNEGVEYGFQGGYQQGYQAGRLEGHGDILGCTNPNANNYNSEATFDDGSCTFDPGEGRPGQDIPEENPIGGPDKDGELVGGA